MSSEVDLVVDVEASSESGYQKQMFLKRCPSWRHVLGHHRHDRGMGLELLSRRD
jgi:hypothetical protein